MQLVSVVLPVFNAEQTIARAVHSILDQTWSNLELIVVDDGSTDGTAQKLTSIHDPRLKILTHKNPGVTNLHENHVQESNKGVAASANLAFQNSQAEYVARMDADDISHPQRIEKQMDWLRQHQMDVVGSQVRILNASDQPLESMQRYQAWINAETVAPDSISAMRFVELPLVNPTVFAKRRFFDLLYHDDDLPEDYDLFLRGHAAGMRFGKVPEVLLDWYQLAGGLTRTDSRYSTDAFDRCRKKHLLTGPLENQQTVDLWGAGQTGKPWLKWLLENGISVRYLIDVSPRKIGQEIHGCQVVSPEAIGPGTTNRDANHSDVNNSGSEIPLVIAVGREGARQLILEFIEKAGYVPGKNAWFVA